MLFGEHSANVVALCYSFVKRNTQVFVHRSTNDNIDRALFDELRLDIMQLKRKGHSEQQILLGVVVEVN